MLTYKTSYVIIYIEVRKKMSRERGMDEAKEYWRVEIDILKSKKRNTKFIEKKEMYQKRIDVLQKMLIKYRGCDTFSPMDEEDIKEVQETKIDLRPKWMKK